MVAITKSRMGRSSMISRRLKEEENEGKRRTSARKKEESVRLSKRSRTQAIPYQTPESILKLSAALLTPPLVLQSPPSPKKVTPKTPPKLATTKTVMKSKRESIKEVAMKVATKTRGAAKTIGTQVKPFVNGTSTKGLDRVATRKRATVTFKSAPVDTTPKGRPKAKTPSRKLTQDQVDAGPNSLKRSKKVEPVIEKKSRNKKIKVEKDDTVKTTKTPRKRKAPSLKQADAEGKPAPPKKGRKAAASPAEKKPKKRRGKFALSPKPHVKLYEKDPTFESREEIPDISSLANSRLITRAVLLNDNQLLESYLQRKKWISSRCIPRNTVDDSKPIEYAIMQNNEAAVRLLIDNKRFKEELFANAPALMLEKDSTGHGSHMMFGHAMRAVTVGRGGKEGNAAFLKDSRLYGNPSRIETGIHWSTTSKCLKLGVNLEFLKKFEDPSAYTTLMNHAIDHMVYAVRNGHVHLAGELVKEGNKRGGFGFNFLHEEVLTKKGNQVLTPFKAVSVVKKATQNNRITPLHCAAVNPETQHLSALLACRPEVNVNDQENWNLLHYAAASTSPKPLELLLSRGGLSTLSPNKKGDTPLNITCKIGRLENVKCIINFELAALAETAKEEHAEKDEKKEEEEVDEKPKKSAKDEKKELAAKLSGTSLVLTNKAGYTPLLTAARYGRTDIVKFILQIPGTDVMKGMAAQHDKLNPFMLACAHGHLELVKYLAEQWEELGLKLEQGDRRGRTGLALAVLNGHAHIVSYLLRLGMNHLTKDSSGNTLMHYAAAYGWYFNCKLLQEAGCPINEPNQWKLTPVAAAFMKGHIGIVQMLLQFSEVDINSPVNYQTGMTLLHETCTSSPTQDLIDNITFLVDKHDADVKVKDFNGNNPLHLLIHTEVAELNKYRPHSPYDASVAQNYLIQGVKMLLARGCDPLAVNEEGESPASFGIKKGCFTLLLKTIYKDISDDLVPTTVDKEGNTLLHTLVTFVTKPACSAFYRKLTKRPEDLAKFQEMARTPNKAGLTPLLMFLSSNQGGPYEQMDRRYRIDFLKFLVNDLRSDINSLVKKQDKDTVLHLACSAGASEMYLDIILPVAGLNLEAKNGISNTALAVAAKRGKIDVVKRLINARADVNTVFYQDAKDKDPRTILQLSAENESNELVVFLVEKGADVFAVDKAGESALSHICRKPRGSGALTAIRALLNKGGVVLAKSMNKDGRTALHLCVNSRGGETDVFYDIEETLIKMVPEILAMKDKRNRIPLHYLFVKIGNFQASSSIDPIELTAILVNTMKIHGYASDIHLKDAYQSMPLHYAAARGAIISSTLLFGENVQLLNEKDSVGNTPFALAVLNAHQTCTLHFQQKNADFNVSINTNREVKDSAQVKAEQEASKRENKWTWSLKLEHVQEKIKKAKQSKILTVIEKVVMQEWQGILYLMVESLRFSGRGVAPAIRAGITTQRLKLAQKLLLRVHHVDELSMDKEEGGTLIHTLARYTQVEISGQAEVLKLLLDNGVDILCRDRESNANALVYAGLNQNISLCEAIAKQLQTCNLQELRKSLGPDVYERTPFSAFFWKLEQTQLTHTARDWLSKFSNLGGDDCMKADALTYFPFSLSPLPGVRYIMRTETEKQDANKFSPLIAAVIYKNYAAAKWLLTQRNIPVDVNFQDALGRTALMHAVRLNDSRMVKLLLCPQHAVIPTSELAREVFVHYHFGTNKRNDSGINFSLKDKEGRSVLHYVIQPSSLPYSYARGDEMLTFLVECGAPIKGFGGLALLELAESLGRKHLVQIMAKLQGNKNAADVQYDDLFPPIKHSFFKNVTLPDSLNLRVDALEMAKKLRDEEEEEVRIKNGGKIAGPHSNFVPDPLIGTEASEFEVVIDEESQQPYDIVMTKVDLGYGMFGLYNFYKMQVLQQPKGKGLIMLFTRWGRVGDDGQYQKTPFGTLEEVIKEFKKIFRAKSGNFWEDVVKSEAEGGGFKPQANKYRLVKKSLRAKQPNAVKVNFDVIKKRALEEDSRLPKSLKKLMENLALVHEGSWSREGDLPFGILTEETLSKGEELLAKIETLIKEKDKVKATPGHDQAIEQQLMDSIVEASEEFYTLIPTQGYKSERLTPMFDLSNIREKRELIHTSLHLEFATQFLLGSQFHSDQHNPLDYIYNCLHTKLELVDPKSFESQMILQYATNTSTSCPQITNIFRIEREGENERMRATVDNRGLLWHGTRAVNLISILNRGLQVTPMGVEVNGHLFGKGIYFADMFEKSRKYCYGGRDGRNYMLLCEVALGKVHEVPFRHAGSGIANAAPRGFDSIKTEDSRYIPDLEGIIRWQDRGVPLGRKVDQSYRTSSSNYYRLDYNEYIVFNTNQVSIKYLVEYKK